MSRRSLQVLGFVLAATSSACFADIGDVVKGNDAGASQGNSIPDGAPGASSGGGNGNGNGNGNGHGVDASICTTAAPCVSIASSCLQKPTCICLSSVCGSGGTTCTTSNTSIDMLCGQGGLVCQGKTDGSGIVCVTGTGDVCCQ